MIVLVHDEPQDAEISGVGQGEGPDVDPGFAQNPGDFRQAARLVLQEYRDLFDFHGVSLTLILVALGEEVAGVA